MKITVEQLVEEPTKVITIRVSLEWLKEYCEPLPPSRIELITPVQSHIIIEDAVIMAMGWKRKQQKEPVHENT